MRLVLPGRVWVLRLGLALVLLSAVAGGGAWWLWRTVAQPGPLTETRTLVVPRGSGVQKIATLLAAEGVLVRPWLFVALVGWEDHRDALHAGEYAFPAGASLRDVMDLLIHGRTVVHRLTIPEGTTSHQIMALLKGEAALAGDMPETAPAEGALLPETYHFSLGDSRAALLQRMKASMTQALAEAWKGRAPDLVLKTPEQALTLAAVVEKETGIANERARVAGVFHNRLAAGMKLQSDPTVIYAFTAGRLTFDRALTAADLKVDSPYNTYQREGLPPGPIANPGRAALHAALHPEKHEWLYFVADGSGGHVFAKTLPEHNRNVAHWRQVQRSRGE